LLAPSQQISAAISSINSTVVGPAFDGRQYVTCAKMAFLKRLWSDLLGQRLAAINEEDWHFECLNGVTAIPHHKCPMYDYETYARLMLTPAAYEQYDQEMRALYESS
jgi:hypothetical protein